MNGYRSYDCEALDKCPFCGADAKMESHRMYGSETVTYHAYCTNDECKAVIEKWHYTEEKAIEAWNMRTHENSSEKLNSWKDRMMRTFLGGIE